jgi:hypothetical protein
MIEIEERIRRPIYDIYPELEGEVEDRIQKYGRAF